MYYIVAEDGEVFQCLDRDEALEASEDGISIVIDPTLNVVIVDREATPIAKWEPPEEENADEREDGDE